MVLKFGSEVVADPLKDGIQAENLDHIAVQAAHLYNNGIQPIIVTSGAIALARHDLDINRKLSISEEQALSSYGQPKVYGEYEERFVNCGLKTGQVLLSQENFRNDTQRANVKNALHAMLKFNITPIINENDATATEELRTDNDVISGLVADLVQAEALMLVTQNVRGLEDNEGRVIHQVPLDRQEDFSHFVTDSSGSFTRGGMRSKYDVGCAAATNGIDALIMGSADLSDLEFAFRGQFGTHFQSKHPLTNLGYEPVR